MKPFSQQFEESFGQWDCNKDINEYEAYKAGAKWMAERCAKVADVGKGTDSCCSQEASIISDKIRQIAKELQ